MIAINCARERGGEQQEHGRHHGGGAGGARLRLMDSNESWRETEAQLSNRLNEIVRDDKMMMPAAWRSLHFEHNEDHLRSSYRTTTLNRRDGLVSSGIISFDPSRTTQAGDSQVNVHTEYDTGHRFLHEFVPSVEKVELVNVTSGTEGDICRTCQRFNT